MQGEHHDLVHELPEFREKIHELKVSNNHFAKLFDEYHEVDHEVRRIEQEVETPAPERRAFHHAQAGIRKSFTRRLKKGMVTSPFLLSEFRT